MFSGSFARSEAEAVLTQAFTFANGTTMIIPLLITNKSYKTNRLLLVPMGAMMLTEDDKDGADGEFIVNGGLANDNDGVFNVVSAAFDLAFWPNVWGANVWGAIH